MKEADVKLSWTKSPSEDVAKQVIQIVVDGVNRSIEVGPEVESFVLTVGAKSSVTFGIDTFDKEGNKAASESYSFQLGDLEAPVPATNLFHEVVAVRDASVPVDS